ncbi:helix-turn-helix domain-containing protein [Ureibacillus sp. FSL K6-8385]|uniref:Helix-turn-helix domain-containing protein n=1 Tax=Ureibacillus terrenus TaxID=118246 RepID=A0A540V3U4_9BACL|nr:helix-turn-helix domain-containing protein [Ureibacillus terrenus]MED3660918.1 helix-turn-helix domain-containing protein [Ureibacillus terrenus]MED3763070.1 helix-turn-helix domain-containing protein [Ureibacillus terrenus]TQE91415.1 helix-turn-helix domain-containing protein [Ureibacillus terrenus]
MKYKGDWNWRFEREKEIYRQQFPDYELLTSSSDRHKNYSPQETEILMALYKEGKTYREIAEELGRSYWSVAYKLAEMRKEKRLRQGQSLLF